MILASHSSIKPMRDLDSFIESYLLSKCTNRQNTAITYFLIVHAGD